MAIQSSLIDAAPDRYKEIGGILHPPEEAILVMCKANPSSCLPYVYMTICHIKRSLNRHISVCLLPVMISSFFNPMNVI
jgi:hypothetical protein